jgi:small subunit ribosomal protein S17
VKKMSLTSKIGIPGVTEPSKKCEDPTCPFHGSLKVRGRIFTGTVVKNRMTHAITVQIDYDKFNNKYQRYERRNSKRSVHVPPCIEVNPGDKVRFMQCRKISKTIASVVIQKLE